MSSVYISGIVCFLRYTCISLILKVGLHYIKVSVITVEILHR